MNVLLLGPLFGEKSRLAEIKNPKPCKVLNKTVNLTELLSNVVQTLHYFGTVYLSVCLIQVTSEYV